MIKKDIYRFCSKCGTEYRINTVNQKYCSIKCSEEVELERKEIKDRSKFAIFQRDHFTCCYCGKSSIEDQVQLVIDHIVPRIKGGNNSLYNVVTSCIDCNLKKSYLLLPKEVFKRILKRNIQYNKGISANKRAEIRAGLMLRYKECDQSETMSNVLRK